MISGGSIETLSFVPIKNISGGSIEFLSDQIVPNVVGISFDNEIDFVIIVQNEDLEMLSNITFELIGSIENDRTSIEDVFGASILKSDNFQVIITKSGYLSQTININFSEGDTQRITVTLIQSVCDFAETTFAYLTKVVIPEVQIVDKGFKECCYTNMVLASIDSDRYEENDFTGFYYNRQTDSDTCDFKLKSIIDDSEIDLVDDTYGELKQFNSIEGNERITVFIVDWKKVLTLKGEGDYRVIRDITIAGINVPLESNTFTLEAFTQQRAENTVRIDCTMNGQMVKEGVNFYNSGFRTGLRFKGFFGNRNPKYTQDNFCLLYTSPSPRD